MFHKVLSVNLVFYPVNCPRVTLTCFRASCVLFSVDSLSECFTPEIVCFRLKTTCFRPETVCSTSKTTAGTTYRRLRKLGMENNKSSIENYICNPR